MMNVVDNNLEVVAPPSNSLKLEGQFGPGVALVRKKVMDELRGQCLERQLTQKKLAKEKEELQAELRDLRRSLRMKDRAIEMVRKATSVEMDRRFLAELKLKRMREVQAEKEQGKSGRGGVRELGDDATKVVQLRTDKARVGVEETSDPFDLNRQRMQIISHLGQQLKDQRQHACNICKKKFFLKSSLHVHLQAHRDRENGVNVVNPPNCKPEGAWRTDPALGFICFSIMLETLLFELEPIAIRADDK